MNRIEEYATIEMLKEELSGVLLTLTEREEKVLKLYELDSQFNLTKLSSARNLKGVINKELSLKYGGEVLDFSDKNYVLYGHTLSYRENIEDLVKVLNQLISIEKRNDNFAEEVMNQVKGN